MDSLFLRAGNQAILFGNSSVRRVKLLSLINWLNTKIKSCRGESRDCRFCDLGITQSFLIKIKNLVI